jgi:hypothetical protein
MLADTAGGRLKAAELTEDKVRALSVHRTRESCAGRAKRTEARTHVVGHKKAARTYAGQPSGNACSGLDG